MPSRNSWSPWAQIWFLYRHRFGAGRAVDRNAPQGLYSWMKQLNGIYNVRWLPSSLWAFSSRAFRRWRQSGDGDWHNQLHHHQLSGEVRFHFLYVLACTFCINVVVMLGSVLSNRAPRRSPSKMRLRWHETVEKRQDRVNWYPVRDDCVYAGLAEFGGYGTRWLAMIIISLPP